MNLGEFEVLGCSAGCNWPQNDVVCSKAMEARHWRRLEGALAHAYRQIQGFVVLTNADVRHCLMLQALRAKVEETGAAADEKSAPDKWPFWESMHAVLSTSKSVNPPPLSVAGAAGSHAVVRSHPAGTIACAFVCCRVLVNLASLLF